MKRNETLKNGKKRLCISIVLCVLVIAWLVVIFDFSSQTMEVSSAKSDNITESVMSVVKPEHQKPKFYEPDDFYYQVNRIVRKSAHIAVYAVLSILTYFAVGSFAFLPKSIIKPAFISIPVCLMCAALDETHQSFVEGRFGRVVDVAIDGIGIVVGIAVSVLAMLLFKAIMRRRIKRV